MNQDFKCKLWLGASSALDEDDSVHRLGGGGKGTESQGGVSVTS